jgi:phenylpropionate dioxygenase-like ring-hydroxylating dioxygenase large terminal subunit
MTDSPMTAPTAAPDSAALRRCWHPVCRSDALARDPLATQLLGEALVVWRDSAGRPHAFADLCIHRGTALSLGWVDGDRIVCPYHGWQYGVDGGCKLIPQLPDPTRIPGKARVASFRCEERHGLVWVSLDEPRWETPRVAELEAPDWITIYAGPYSWSADASRQIENFTDFGHFAWVHPGLLGDKSRPVVPAHTVSTEGHVLHYSIVRPEAPNSEDYPIFANEESVQPERRSRYELHLPYTLVLRVGWGGSKGMVYFFASQPNDEDNSTGYLAVARNYDMDQDPSILQRFEDTIFNQDERVVESQRPHQVPFDLADELHLKFDAVAVAYRRAMRAHGLAT